MKKVKKILSTIGNVIFYIFVVIMVGIIGFSIYGKKTNKAVLDYSFLWVKTASMEPDIQEKSYILVKKVKDTNDIEVGDVITFISTDPTIKGEYNTHEVVEIIGDHESFITKGTNNNAPDIYPVPKENVVYEYVGNLKVMTFCARVYSTPAGLACTLVLIFAGIIIYLNIFLKNMRKEEKEEKMKELIAKEVERLKENGGNINS